MGKGSKWRKTDYKKYWDNWPSSMSKSEVVEKPKKDARKPKRSKDKNILPD